MKRRRMRTLRRQERQRRHRLGMESLEDRALLSGTHDAAILAALRSLVSSTNPSGLGAWSDRLGDASLLGRDVPLLGTQLGSQFSPRALINASLSQLATSYASLSDLQAGLSTIPGITVSAQRDILDRLELDVRMKLSTKVDVPLNPAFGGVDLAATGSVSLDVKLDFQLTLGATWDSNAAVAYVGATGESLQVSATVSGGTLAAAARLGFTDVALSGFAPTFGAAYGFDLLDPGAGGSFDGRITTAELFGTPVATLVKGSLAATQTATFSASMTSSLVPGDPLPKS